MPKLVLVFGVERSPGIPVDDHRGKGRRILAPSGMVDTVRAAVRPIIMMGMMGVVAVIPAISVPRVGRSCRHTQQCQRQPEASNGHPDEITAAVRAQNRHCRVPLDLASARTHRNNTVEENTAR